MQTHHWFRNGIRRRTFVAALHVPKTCAQIRKTAQLTTDALYEVARELRLYGVICCLNPLATRSRLYWLTSIGRQLVDQERVSQELPPIGWQLPDLNWQAYSQTCFSHRSAIIRALRKPTRTIPLRRAILRLYPGIKLSESNLRDCLLFLTRLGILERNGCPPMYDLTSRGKQFQDAHDKVLTPHALFDPEVGLR